MAANAPVLLQRSMVEGFPAEGVMSSGQVAALIGELQSCREVIDGIVASRPKRGCGAVRPKPRRRACMSEQKPSSRFQTQVHDNGVAEVVLNRPPVNALNAAGWNASGRRDRRAGRAQPEVRVIVIRAEGRASAPASTSRS
jgi:hypothetical protein